MYLPDGRRDDEFLRVFRRKGKFDHIFANLLYLRGADPDRKDQKGWPPVLFSARRNSTDALSWLKNKDANMEARDNLGSSGLHVAAINGNVESVRWLLGNTTLGPDPRTLIGATPLHWAIDQKIFREDVLDALELGGADLSAITVGGWRCIDFAMNRKHSGWQGDYDKCIEWLRKRGAAGDAPPRARTPKPKWWKKGDKRMLRTCRDGNDKNRIKMSANQDEDHLHAIELKRAEIKRKRLEDDNKHTF